MWTESGVGKGLRGDNKKEALLEIYQASTGESNLKFSVKYLQQSELKYHNLIVTIIIYYLNEIVKK